ncbi:hypothetical protein [Maribacter sp.]|uniref:hypothetical protein n=1 Tax=Maribacter sp. TaxID=1897614 RepID=UPI0025C4AA87|nr:hypothetical protein [Maribacter sp.]
MTTISIADKLNFIFESFKKNAAIFLFTIPFILAGSIVVYFATQADEPFGMYVFGITFIAVPLLIILYTFPSSFMYYYEQAIAKKYGYYTKATIIDKEIEDVSYTRTDGGSVITIKNYNYIITYVFDYKSVTYSNSFSVEDKTVFDDLKLKSLIPIKFLRTAPGKATVLIRNLTKKK